MTNPDTVITRIGIIDAVKAMRKGSDVKHIVATLRFETDLAGTYYGEENKVDEMLVSFPVGEAVNPGDLVELTVRVTSPFGARFAPALPVGDTHADS